MSLFTRYRAGICRADWLYWTADKRTPRRRQPTEAFCSYPY